MKRIILFLLLISLSFFCSCPKNKTDSDKTADQESVVSIPLNELGENNNLFPTDTNTESAEINKLEAKYPFKTPFPDPIGKVGNNSIPSELVMIEFNDTYKTVLDREAGEANPLRLMQILNVHLLTQLKETFYLEIAAENKLIYKNSERSDAAGLGAVEYQKKLDKKYGKEKGMQVREIEVLKDLNDSLIEVYDPFLICYRALDGDADRTAEARAKGKDKIPKSAFTETRNVKFPTNQGTMITVYSTGKPRFEAAIQHAKALMVKYPEDYRGGYFLSCFYKYWQENPGEDKPKISAAQVVELRKQGIDAAYKADPENPYIQLELADVLVALGNKSEAETYLEMAFKNPLSGVSVYDALKVFYTKRLGNSDKAVQVDQLEQKLIKKLEAQKKADTQQTN